MKSMLLKVLFILGACASSGAHASFILNGTSTIEELNLSESVIDFYDYNSSSAPFSSNTGYEINDVFVFLLAEFGGSYYLVGTTDGTVATSDNSNGRVNINLIDNLGTSGGVIFVDDSNDTQVSTINSIFIDFVFGTDANDGFIYDLGDGTNVSLSASLELTRGVTDAIFLDFSGSSTPSVIDISDSFELRSAVAVSSPPMFLLLSLTILAFTCRNRRR